MYFSGRNPDAESIDGAQTMVVTAMVSSSAEAESAETMLDQERNQTDADVVAVSQTTKDREEHNTSPEQPSIASSDQALSQYSASISLGDGEREVRKERNK